MLLYLQLFYTFFKIGLFGFGGGYMLSLIQGEVVVQHSWLTPQSLPILLLLMKMTPGPIGINAATYVGYTATQSVWGQLLPLLL